MLIQSRSKEGQISDRENIKPLPKQEIARRNVRPRLIPESKPCAGRLEIHSNGKWATVCKDVSWSFENAETVCKLLDCGSAAERPLTPQFGPGSGPFIGPPDCGHKQDVEVICSDYVSFAFCNILSKMFSDFPGRRIPRLVDGESQCSGRLEILYAGNWETVCDLHWDLDIANVVCAQLNCGVALSVPRGIRFGSGTGLIRRNRLECKGSETSLLDCALSPVTQHECSHSDDVSVICSSERWPLRLTNGGSRCDGKVEIYQDGSWGQLQDKMWDLNDASVVCRQLGCGVAIAAYNSSKYGEGGTTVWSTNVQCKGNESHLRHCSTAPLDSPVPDSIGVGVLCSDHMQIRLSGAVTRCAGRLEIYYNGTWGSVCDDAWDMRDADVVCKQLGCGRALNTTLPASCERNSGPIWLDEVKCSGREEFLWQCPSASWNNHDCNHEEDVRIVCSEHKELRLVNGKHRCEGRVEVFYNGTWGTVCSDSLEDHDAQVICKHLQCGDFVSQGIESFGRGSGKIWLDEIECNLQETTLWQCQSAPWGKHDCNHFEDTGVTCSESGLPLRLAGGNSNCSGIVEIFNGKTWGTVCDDSWDMADANVVCRQMACGPAVSASGGITFAQIDREILLDEVKCKGRESFLSDCSSSRSAHPDCEHKEDASVICSGKELNVRLVNGGSRCAGRLEARYRQGWGTVHDYNWDLKDAAVVCRELGCGTALSAPRWAHFGEGSGSIAFTDVQCAGTESALQECSQSSSTFGLSHSNDAGVICSGNVRPRLIPESKPCAGRLEIHSNGKWATVCKDVSWSFENAETVCKLLDCGSAAERPLTPQFGPGSGPFIGPPDCGHKQDVEVICSDYVSCAFCYILSKMFSDFPGRRIPRLVDGESQCSGRLEILYAGNWETVCVLHWDLDIANVVCAQLNCGVALSVPRGIRFGRGTGLIRRNRLECKGSETSLLDCALSPVTQHECSHSDDVSVICSSERWPLRLTNGGSRCDGKVEIYQDGSWGQLQDKMWDLNDASVVCRQLGCGVAIAAYNSSKYGEGGTTVWSTNVQCKGNESHLRHCSTAPFDSPVPDSIGVGVLCSDHMQIRLSGSVTRCAGRLEIYYNGTWGSVCDDAWDMRDADVVCKQLGCGRALNTTLPASCERNSGPIWLDEVKCSGREEFLWQCPSASWNKHDCNHKEDVRIVCSEHKELRLVNGKHRCEGRVEVFYNGTWGTVCSENLEDHDAQVICKHLQCGDFISQGIESFGRGSGKIWLDEIECNLQETTLWQCQSAPWGKHDCNHFEDTGVTCSGNTMTLRLAGGNSNCSGIVEIFNGKTWGTVCDDSWDMADASVVCRQMACGPAVSASGGITFAQIDREILLGEVKCKGRESFLSDCPSSRSAHPDCEHKEDASVICSEPDFSPTPSPSTPAEQGDKISPILAAVCIALAALLLCELIMLLAVRRRIFTRKGALTDDWVSPSVLYQGIYEEIDNIAVLKDSAQTEGSGTQFDTFTSPFRELNGYRRVRARISNRSLTSSHCLAVPSH
ncbi:deleted in malignant brain tumors 1 protein-like [Stegostoma tigrinum]|uniref:deleted in malignant brain tumors 1 protein-like n=1 Tax=Stegostoma tigrinum TaxID=3053191 RepID=UPI00287097D4|nr:deleted in malignant brain tumors 1 protein-like [Stegostoma tigrinum]